MSPIKNRLLYCDNCKKEFGCWSVKIDKCDIVIGNEKLMLEYFVCPQCDHIYRVLLVNEWKYRNMVDELLTVEHRIKRRFGKKNIEVMDNLQKLAVAKRERIKRYINGMNHRYNGTFTFTASENNQKEIIYLP